MTLSLTYRIGFPDWITTEIIITSYKNASWICCLSIYGWIMMDTYIYISEWRLDVAFKHRSAKKGPPGPRHWSAAFALRRLSGFVTRSPRATGGKRKKPGVVLGISKCHLWFPDNKILESVRYKMIQESETLLPEFPLLHIFPITTLLENWTARPWKSPIFSGWTHLPNPICQGWTMLNCPSALPSGSLT